MKNKRIFTILLTGFFLLALVGATAFFIQLMEGKSSKVYHVGILSGLDFFADTVDGFKTEMAGLGYVEGKNIVYDLQKTNVDIASYRSIVNKFIADKVDLIFVFPTEASMEAKTATRGTNIPVVFANAFTEDTGLVESVREPGGGITGVRWVGPDLALQRFEIMRELVPQAKRMWVPYQKGYPIVKSQLEVLRPAAAAAGLTLTEIPADNAAELELAFKEQVKSGVPDAILIIAEPLLVTPDSYVVAARFAAEHKIPIGGALMSGGGYETVFGVTPRDIPQGRQAAFLADKIFKGTPAGTIPVVSADGYFQFNYRIAEKLGLNVPEDLLNRANEIIR